MNAKISMAAFAIAATAAMGSEAYADPRGTWLTADGDAHVRIANCGADAFCGTVVWLKQPLDTETGRPLTDKQNPNASRRSRPVVGIQILLGMRPNGGNRWSGQIYNSDDGNTYEGNIAVANANTLRVEGCLLGFCQSQNWERVIDASPARPRTP